MRAGLFAGAVAAIIAALVSLPLHSPVDSAFNSATVAVAALILGGISGLLWSRFSERLLWYAGIMAALFVAVLVIAFAGNSFLDRFVSFVVPLAAIAFVVTAALTPLLAGYFNRPNLGWKSWTPPAVAVIAALALGFGLITQGDAESGDLALPPRPTAAVSPAQPSEVTQAPASSGTAYVIGSDAYVVGEGSEITFTVEEELGGSPVRFDAVISGTGLSGTANLDGQPSVVTLDLHSLSSDQQYRDRYIQSQMFPDTPEAVVTVDSLPDLPQSFFDGEETYRPVERLAANRRYGHAAGV